LLLPERNWWNTVPQGVRWLELMSNYALGRCHKLSVGLNENAYGWLLCLRGKGRVSTALIILWAHNKLSDIGLNRALQEWVFQWLVRNRREFILYLAPKTLKRRIYTSAYWLFEWIRPVKMTWRVTARYCYIWRSTAYQEISWFLSPICGFTCFCLCLRSSATADGLQVSGLPWGQKGRHACEREKNHSEYSYPC
jgi:hypothetical protein